MIITTSREYIRLAYSNIAVYKMRSFLTMLGIIIAITSLIVMLMLGESNKAKMFEEMKKVGVSTVRIDIDSMGENTLNPTLSDRDMEHVPFVEYASFEFRALQPVMLGIHTEDSEIIGIGTHYFDVVPIPDIVRGRLFLSMEIQNNLPVCVIDNISFERYLKYGATHTISVNGIACTVIGVYKTIDNPLYHTPTVYMPSAFVQTLPMYRWSMVLKMRSTENMDTKIKHLKTFLSLVTNNATMLKVMSSQQMIEFSQRISKQLATFIFGITFILLVVGGIGIMNIMLVSVAERTREIGIRRALGATIHAIFFQFISETLLLCFIAGCVGICIGGLIGYSLIVWFHYVMIIPVQPIMIGIAISLCTGIASGLYPSLHAARKNPIQALQYE